MFRLGVVPEPAEVHDAADAGRGRGSSATFGQAAIAIAEVVRAERVHEVVGDITAGQTLSQRGLVADIDRAGPNARDLGRVARQAR